MSNLALLSLHCAELYQVRKRMKDIEDALLEDAGYHLIPNNGVPGVPERWEQQAEGGNGGIRMNRADALLAVETLVKKGMGL